MIAGIPLNDTEPERRAIVRVFETRFGAVVVLIAEPILGAIGAGLDFEGDKACMYGDIGGGTF